MNWRFITRRTAIAVRAVAIALIAAGCYSDTGGWTNEASPKANKLKLVRLAHDVPFASTDSRFAGRATSSLDHFLARQDIGYGDRVYVVASKARGRSRALNDHRTEVVRRHLLRQGLEPDVLDGAEWATQPKGDAVRVLVHRYIVVPPNCPDWRKPAHQDPSNTTSSNFGCTNAVNFGLMVANPRHMMEGDTLAPMDGERAAAAIKRYREGKEKELTKEGVIK
jgi:pilus assembly protein CpaD